MTLCDDDAPIIEEGVIAGNFYNKYQTANPIARKLMKGFCSAINDLVSMSGVTYIHEVGCGEGYLSVILAQGNKKVRATDFSNQVINKAKDNAKNAGVDIEFQAVSIYDLIPERDSAELVVCCEVLEHLDDPLAAMGVLAKLSNPYLLVSVPREPIWRILNIIRLKYISRRGNTPGHINHWNKKGFIKMIDKYVDIVKVVTPLPWTIALCRRRR